MLWEFRGLDYKHSKEYALGAGRLRFVLPSSLSIVRAITHFLALFERNEEDMSMIFENLLENMCGTKCSWIESKTRKWHESDLDIEDGR